MIHIEKNQNIADNENLRVATPTGDYEDGALIEFYDTNDEGAIAGTFQAQYIKYGGMVYSFGGHKELGEGILKIDPNSTHTAASFVRMTNQLLAQMEEGSLEPSSLDQVITEEQAKTTDQIEDPQEDLPTEEIPPEEVLPEEEINPEEPEAVLDPEVIVPDEVVPEVIEEEAPTTTEEPVSVLSGRRKRKIA